MLAKKVIGKNDQETKYVGTIISVNKESSYYNNYVVEIKEKKSNILLKVKKNKYKKNIKLEYGDLIYITGNIEKPAIKRNYKGFDYSKYLQTKNIYAICKSNADEIQIIKKNSLSVYNMWINKLQNKLKENLGKVLPNETASVAVALLLGDTSMINDKQKNTFSNASLSHILAISGMHVSYVIMGCSFLLKKFDKRKSKYMFMILLIFFAQLTGGSPSVVRAVIMSCIMIISKLVYRKSDTINNISIACLFILIINPYNILNLGFQLSFLGTLGIVLFNSKIKSVCNEFNTILKNKIQGMFDRPKGKNDIQYTKSDLIDINELSNIHAQRLRQNVIPENIEIDIKQKHNTINKFCQKIKSIVLLSISANILIIPILIYEFNIFSLTFLISNIIVTPILGVMCFMGYVTVGTSLISIGIAKVFSIPLNIFIQVFNKIAEFSANITFTRFTTTTPTIITIIAYYLIVFYLYFNKKDSKRNLKIPILGIILVIIFNSVFSYKSGLKIHFIDVGQGDSTLIITNANKRILIDGGGSETGDYDVGESVLLPYLLARGIKTIDYMIFSHFDSDHCKGLFSVMEKLKVKNAIISKQGEVSDNYDIFLKLAQSKNIKIICVSAGDRLKIDNFTYIDIIWPNNNLIYDNILNNNSIVCKLNYKGNSILFTGDIEKIAEEKILEKYDEEILDSTILKVAHHGSKSSSTKEFIAKVQPRISLIGVGEKNNFGHPNENVIERLKAIRC